MVPERILGRYIASETFAFFIVVVVYGLSVPVACARIMLAGMWYVFICRIARSLYFWIYASLTLFCPLARNGTTIKSNIKYFPVRAISSFVCCKISNFAVTKTTATGYGTEFYDKI